MFLEQVEHNNRIPAVKFNAFPLILTLVEPTDANETSRHYSHNLWSSELNKLTIL